MGTTTTIHLSTSGPPPRGKPSEIASLFDLVDAGLDRAIATSEKRGRLEQRRDFYAGQAERLAARPVLTVASRDAIRRCQESIEQITATISAIDRMTILRVREVRDDTRAVRRAVRVTALIAEQAIRNDRAGLRLGGTA